MGVYKLEYFSKEVKSIIQPTVSKVMDRYDTKIRLRREDGRLQVRPLSLTDMVAKKTEQDLLHTILPYERYRPDLLALNYYGDARLYWIILAANGLSSSKDLVEGLIVRIPSMTAIYSKGGVMN